MHAVGQVFRDKATSACYRVVNIQKFKGTTRIGYELELVETNPDLPRRLNRFEPELTREFELVESTEVQAESTETPCPAPA